MFLRATNRKKDGKNHRYFSVVENRRVSTGGVMQRTVLYLGEINDSQEAAWRKSLEVFDEGRAETSSMSLFPADRELPVDEVNAVQVKLHEMELCRPRSFGNCWLACEMWQQLELDEFWKARLPEGREHVGWSKVLQLLVVNRLIDPGSEFRLHRQWFDQSAMDELLGTDFAVAGKDRLYRCLDKILKYKEEVFQHLTKRWNDLFRAQFDVLLFDLTSTYFEGRAEGIAKARYGYSRDKRPDCLQVVIALVVTPDGFPLAYEVMNGNTSEKTTLRGFLKKIEEKYGKAERMWVMDRGIPTEEILKEMRESEQAVYYLVGTPRSRIGKTEQKWLGLPWHKVRESVDVKLWEEEGEIYVLAKSEGRREKEKAIRRRKLVRLIKTLRVMRRSLPSRDQLMMRLGEAKGKAGSSYRFMEIRIPGKDEAVTRDSFSFKLNKEKLKVTEIRDGHYLLRSNLSAGDPSVLWARYIQLTEIEAAFRIIKSELEIRPIYHRTEARVEAHIMVAFLAYCLMVTLNKRLEAVAPGLTGKAVLEKLSTIQMLDVVIPTTDGRSLEMRRYTQPERDQKLLLDKMNMKLPKQPPPRIRTQRLALQAVNL
jgi:transposase